MVIRDEETESVIREIIKPILKSANIPSENVNIYIISDNQINAFVANGQNVFINTGLLKFSDDINVIAGVLAHEVGHIVGGHLMLQNSEIQNLKTKMILSMLTGIAIAAATGSPEPIIASSVVGQDASINSFLRFSREKESMADQFGMKVMKEVGINPSGLMSLMKYFAQDEKFHNADAAPYLLTHPLSKERMRVLDDFASHNIFKNGYSQHLKDQYKFVAKKIYGFTTRPQDALDHFKGASDRFSEYGLSVALMRNGENEKAVTIVNRLIDSEPANPYFHEFKGEVLYLSGDVANALASYKQAHALRPSSNLLKLEYATALILAKQDIDEAIRMLENVTNQEPLNQSAWKELINAYQQKGEKVKEQIAFANYLFTIGRNDKALQIIKRLSAEDQKLIIVQDLKNAIEESEQ
jgi:predicted Zn-dependent protease